MPEFAARCRTLPEPGSIAFAEVAQPRPATLLVPLVEVDGEVAFVVTKRGSGMRHHRDDWVFPGGALDPGETSGDAAVREAEEELGIDRSAVELLGRLTTRGPIITGYVIDVHVGLVHAAPPFDHHPGEVAEVAVVPLSRLAAAAAHETRTTMPDFVTGPFAEGATSLMDTTRPLHYFAIRDGEWLWGLQGDVVAELFSLVLL